MKKFIPLLIGSTLASLSLSAQITIESTDLTLPIQPQIASRYIVDTQVYNVNPIWNYQNPHNIIGRDTISFLTSDMDTTFGTTTHMQSSGMSFGGLTIPNSTAYLNHSTTGLYIKGLKMQEFGLPIGNNDTVKFLTQNVVYPNNGSLLFPFPINATTDIHDTVTSQIAFQLTYAPLFNNAPGYVKRNTINVLHYERDIKIALPYGNDTLDAVILEVSSESVDSFYINNAPVPAMLLTALNLQQGSKSYVTKSYVFGKGYNYPLAEATFTDENRTDLVDLRLLALHNPPTNSIQNLDLSEVKLYPNPATKYINIALEETITSKVIYDLSGKVITKEANDQKSITVDHLNKGLYLLEITTTSGKKGYIKFSKD